MDACNRYLVTGLVYWGNGLPKMIPTSSPHTNAIEGDHPNAGMATRKARNKTIPMTVRVFLGLPPVPAVTDIIQKYDGNRRKVITASA